MDNPPSPEGPDDAHLPTDASREPSDSGQAKRPRRRHKVIYKLKQAHKDWIKHHFTKFVSKIGRCGAKGDTVRAYCTNTIAPRFMTEFHKDDDPEDEKTIKDQYEADFSIYVFLSNMWKKEHRKLMKLDGPDGDNGVGGSGPGRFNPQYFWAEVNSDRIAAEVEKRIDEDPDLAKDVGLWRRVVSELFHAKSLEEQGKWKNQAEREKAQHMVATKSQEPLSDREKLIFIKTWCTEMSALIKRGEARAGIQSLVHFGALEIKEENGEEKKTMGFKSFTNPQINGYTRMKDFQDSEVNFRNYVAESMGKRVERSIPIAITPADDGAPVIPELPDNPVLSLLRDLVQPAMKAHWRYAAGQGKVPWTEISRAIAAGNYDWVEKKRLPTERLPSGERVRLVDPGEMTIDECIIWLRHLKRRQLGETDITTLFQFQQVYTTRIHVFPEWTKSTIKKPTRRAHVEVFLVKYKGYLDRPETYDPIRYDDNSWDYFYRNTGKAGLVHWMGLPARPKVLIPPQISSSEIEVYQAWFDSVKETQPQLFDQIFSTLKLLNRLDRGVPCIAEDELWRLSNNQPRDIPLTIPQSPASSAALLQWLASPWVPSYFLSPHDAGKTGTVTFFESWQHPMRSGPMYHAWSKTFWGGRLGVAWIIRGVLKHLANVGAGAGVLKLLKDSPPGSDFTRTTLADWDRATKWLKEWHGLLEGACQSLESTARERTKSVVALTGGDVDQAPTPDRLSLEPSAHTTSPVDNTESDSVKHRSSKPRHAKSSVTYVDPYLELDESRSEYEGSGSSSNSDKESVDLDSDESSRELQLPALLKPASIKHGNYDGRTYVFGPNPKMKAVSVEPYPEKICYGIDTYFETTSELFLSYTSMKSQHGLPYTRKLRDWIQENTSSLEEPRWHLISTILLQCLTWHQAQVIWPKAESQYREFLAAFRQGCALLDAIQAAKDEGATGRYMEDILTREEELTARVWATRLVFKQFKAFATLSTQYANKLRDRFLTIPLNSGLSELKRVVALIRDWRQDYSTITQDLRECGKAANENYQLDEYVPHVQNSWFWHGNPSGFVLSAKAEELVQDISPSTEIVYKDEEEEKNSRSSKDAGGRARSPTVAVSASLGNSRGANRDKEGSVVQSGSSAKMMKRPKPKTKEKSAPSPQASQTSLLLATSSTTITLPSVVSTPRSGTPLGTSLQQLSPPPTSGSVVEPRPEPLLRDPSTSPSASHSRQSSNHAPTGTSDASKSNSEVAKDPPRKANGKSSVLNTPANSTSAQLDVATNVTGVSNPSKKRKASAGAAPVIKCKNEENDIGSGERSETMHEGAGGASGHPKRIRVLTARARGVS